MGRTETPRVCLDAELWVARFALYSLLTPSMPIAMNDLEHQPLGGASMARRNSRGHEPAGGQRGFRGGVRRTEQVLLLMTALHAYAWPCHGQTSAAKGLGAAE